MSVLQKNIVANFGGSILLALVGLIFVPIYIHFMGIEAYGLIGIFTTLLTVFALFDMGLSNTLNREMALLAVQEDKAHDMRDLVRTLEIPYWLIGLTIAMVIVLVSPLIAYHWIRVKNLSLDSVESAIMLMGVCVAFEWPIALYSGGLMGLQRQVLLNAIKVSIAIFRGLGAVFILWLISSTTEAFFFWQIAVSAINVGLVMFFLWSSMPCSSKSARFHPEMFFSIWRFAAGMTGITVTGTMLTQLDKVILSRMLNLETFGYYTLANVVAMSLYRLMNPVFTAAFPRLTSFVQLRSIREITTLYHWSAQLVSVLVLPTAILISLFSKELLLLWTRSTVTANTASVLVSTLAMGTAIHCIVYIPFALQLAYGWTQLNLTVNVLSVLLLVPLLIFLTKWYGMIGAASVWVILNIGYFLIIPQFMHRRLLIGEKWRWYLGDVGRPFLAAIVIGLIGRHFIRPQWSPAILMSSLGFLSGGMLLASACVANQLNVSANVMLFMKIPQIKKWIQALVGLAK